MASTRPTTGPDHVGKEVLIHVGLVFAGHLDVDRLDEAASQVTTVFPELNVVTKRKWYPFGKWQTPAATSPAWTFRHRDLPDARLGEAFAPAEAASVLNLETAGKITHLGTVQFEDMLSLFSFDAPVIGSHGWSDAPILNFRATLLGSKDEGHTLLTLIVPHLITDAIGSAAIIETWGKLYNGEALPSRKTESHPDLLSALGPIEDQHEAPKRTGKLEDGMSRGILDLVSFMSDVREWQAQGLEEHYLHFPKTLLVRQREEASKLLSGNKDGVSLSRYDIFCAIIIKLLACSRLVADESQPFDFYGVYSLLPAFPKDTLPDPYLHNLNTLAYNSLPAVSEIVSMPIGEVAIILRRRLLALRTPSKVRQSIQEMESDAATLLRVPRVHRKHGWGMVSSWQAIDKQARAGFTNEKLLFLCPQNQNPGNMTVPNCVWPFGDGEGGIFTRITTTKGDWEIMWEKSGLSNLE